MIKKCLTKIILAASIFSSTLLPASAKKFTIDNIDFMEIVSLNDISNVVILKSSPNTKLPIINNTVFYDNKEYLLSDLKVISENKLKINGITYLEVQDPTNKSKYVTDVIIDNCDLEIDKVDPKCKYNKWIIAKSFTNKDKVYRVKAINKDIVEKFYEKNIKIKIVKNIDDAGKYMDWDLDDIELKLSEMPESMLPHLACLIY